MTINRKYTPALIIIAYILSMILITILLSCNGQKMLRKVQYSKDSTTIASLRDSVRLMRSENEKLVAEIKELQYVGIQFDTVYLNGRIDTVSNTVIVTKEGDIKASGNISSAYVSKTVLKNVIYEKDNIIDSLSIKLKQEQNNVKIKYQDKIIEKKQKFPYWMLIAAFVLGNIFWQYFGNYIISFILKLKNFLLWKN